MHVLTSLQTCSWIPVDYAAEAVAELLLTDRPSRLVYHLENPIRQSWHDVLIVLASALGLSSSGLLPFDEWLQKVDTAEKHSTMDNPVKKLSGFFRSDFRHMACGDVILETTNTRDVSKSLRSAGVVGNETLASYINYWKSIEFLK